MTFKAQFQLLKTSKSTAFITNKPNSNRQKSSQFLVVLLNWIKLIWFGGSRSSKTKRYTPGGGAYQVRCRNGQYIVWRVLSNATMQYMPVPLLPPSLTVSLTTAIYNLPEYQLNRLQRIQNSLARPVVRAPKSSHITPFLRSLHWLKIRTNRQ